MYSAHNVVKAYNGDKQALKEFNKLNDKLYEELGIKYDENMSEKMGTYSPEYEEFEINTSYKPRSYDPSSLGMVESTPVVQAPPPPAPVVETPVAPAPQPAPVEPPKPQRIKYDGVGSQYADRPEFCKSAVSPDN